MTWKEAHLNYLVAMIQKRAIKGRWTLLSWSSFILSKNLLGVNLGLIVELKAHDQSSIGELYLRMVILVENIIPIKYGCFLHLGFLRSIIHFLSQRLDVESSLKGSWFRFLGFNLLLVRKFLDFFLFQGFVIYKKLNQGVELRVIWSFFLYLFLKIVFNLKIENNFLEFYKNNGSWKIVFKNSF